MTPSSSPSYSASDTRLAGDRLDSWKDIAAYLKRDVSTVQRWEKHEGLPVRRHFHRKLGSVYAHRSDIDEWRRRRALGVEGTNGQQGEDLSPGSESTAERAPQMQRRRVLAAAGALALASALTLLVNSWPDGNGIGDRPEIDATAFQEYVLGRYHLSKQNEADIARAIHHFEQATELEPKYGAAYAALSDAWWARGVWGAQTLGQVESASRAAAQKALASSPEVPEARVSLGRIRYTYDQDWAGAEADFQRALAIDPDNRDAHYFYAMLLMGLGRFPEAIDHIQRAAEIDPLSSMIQSGFGRVLYRARRYDEAIDHLQRAIALEPRNPSAFSRLGDVYDMTGRYAEALASYDEARSAGLSDVEHIVKRARVYARMGRADEARRLLENLEHASGKIPPVESAQAYTALGDRDRAFELLFRVLDEPSRSALLFLINEDPAFDGLRSDARWKTLLVRLNLVPTPDATPHIGTH